MEWTRIWLFVALAISTACAAAVCVALRVLPQFLIWQEDLVSVACLLLSGALLSAGLAQRLYVIEAPWGHAEGEIVRFTQEHSPLSKSADLCGLDLRRADGSVVALRVKYHECHFALHERLDVFYEKETGRIARGVLFNADGSVGTRETFDLGDHVNDWFFLALAAFIGAFASRAAPRTGFHTPHLTDYEP